MYDTYQWEDTFSALNIRIMALQKLGSFFPPYSTLHSETAMATHFTTLAWKIPWMEEPGRLQSIGSLRVGHD